MSIPMNMMKLIFILCLFFAVNEIRCKKSKIEGRVIGGSPAPRRRIKSVVFIIGTSAKSNQYRLCGATLVHPRWIVTAAHCVYDTMANGKTTVYPALWRVGVGSNSISSFDDKRSKRYTSFSKRKHRYVEEIILHPQYRKNIFEYDIAMMKLKKPLTDKHIATAAYIPPITDNYLDWPREDDICLLTGWGCVNHAGASVSEARIVQLNVMSNLYCSALYNQGADLNYHHEFCAGFFNKNKGICSGDSGSGLYCLVGNKLVFQGIASAGHSGKPGSFPGIFTRVSFFRTWIEDTIREY